MPDPKTTGKSVSPGAPPQSPAAQQQAVPANPPAAPTFTLTQQEKDALLTDAVAKATEGHQTAIAELTARLRQAESLTDDEKRVDTLKQAYMIGHGMPEEVAEAAASFVDAGKRDKFIAQWRKAVPAVNAEALASAKAKIAAGAATEVVEDLSGGGVVQTVSDKELIRRMADGEGYDPKAAATLLKNMGVNV